MSDDQYVLDRNDLIWRVVRDGGMATRADYTGVTSIGIDALAHTAGPLAWFIPATVRAALYADKAAR